MQPHEVTYGEFRRLFPNHDNGKYTHEAYDNYPAINVTWYEAVAYAAWLGGSIPTVAQWQVAAEAGALDRDTEWFEHNSDGHIHPVDETRPKGRLYDLYGNVWEWCLDDREPETGRHQLRGGSFLQHKRVDRQ